MVPGCLLAFSVFRLLTDTPSWRSVASVVLAAAWLYLAIKRRQALMAAESLPMAPPSAAPDHSALGMVRQMQRERTEDTPRVPTEEEMRASTRPAIHLRRAALPVPLDHPGRSYLGGLPRMPAELPWPEKEVQEANLRFAMNFVGQIDLAELPAVEGSPLPRSGTLFFFADLEIDAPEPDDCRVLYYAGDTTKLPLRDMPALSEDIGLDLCPWLPWDSAWARRNFRFPLEFVAFDSVRDYVPKELAGMPPPRNREAFDRLMAAEAIRLFGTRAPAAESAWKVFRDAGDTWPFAWVVIEHAARTVVHEVGKVMRWHGKSAGVSEFRRIGDAAEKWVDRATREIAHARVADEVRAEFIDDWRRLIADLETTSRRLNIHASDPDRERPRFLIAACYACASGDALDVIPPVYRDALEQLNGVSVTFPRHQMLGHAEKVQWAPIENADQVLLLQLLGDDALGWQSHDGCARQFWGRAKALQQKDFESVEMSLDCD